jgi:hypothetical protein
MPDRSALSIASREAYSASRRSARPPCRPALLKRRIKRFEERRFRLRRRLIQRSSRGGLSVLPPCGLCPFAKPLPASTVRYLPQRGPTCSPGPASGHAPDSRDSNRHYRRRSARQPAILDQRQDVRVKPLRASARVARSCARRSIPRRGPNRLSHQSVGNFHRGSLATTVAR